jgi:hypothetical protein
MGVRAGLQQDQQGRCHLVRSSIRHQPYIHPDIVASKEDPLSLHLDDRHLSSRHLIRDHSINNSIDCNNSGLVMFSRIDQDSRSVGHHLLLWVPVLLDQRRGLGSVRSHTTSAIAMWRGLEHPDHPDPLLWEIWARPIGFMQR